MNRLQSWQRAIVMRVRARRRAASYYRVPLRYRSTGRWAERNLPRALLGVRFLATLGVTAFLALAAFYPAGRSPYLPGGGTALLAPLTHFPVGDVLGFYKTEGLDGFIVYRIFSEQGKVLEGAFPDQDLSPRLRYDRWAMLGHHAGEAEPAFHTLFLDYLVSRLRAVPLRVDMLSAKWAWGEQQPQATTGKDGGILVLRKLGSYDGLRRQWRPATAMRGQ